jgi:opacity protein-like surface antigen
MAGAGIQLSERVILDLGWRFIECAKPIPDRDSFGVTKTPALRVDDLTAHEFKVGLRYRFGG